MGDIKLKIMPAKMGDCFLVSILDKQNTNILIDGGYSDTYKNFLKREILEIQKKNEDIDLMVITHIDSDHISGAISFLADNRNIKANIKEIWHNSLRHAYKGERHDSIIESNDLRILESIKMKGMKIPEDSDERKGAEISGIQGTALGAHIRTNNYGWNLAAGGRAICIDEIKEPYRLNEAKIILLSPTRGRLEALGEAWEEELKRNKEFKGRISDDEIFDDVFEILMTQSFSKRIKKKHKLISGYSSLESYLDDEEIVDEKESNCSSISFVLEYKSKKVLFLGDSNPNDIYESLQRVYKCDETNKLYFDAIKISHHGSEGNTTKKLMDMIDSKKFIISTNGRGRHKHPSEKTIAKIVCRETSFTRELIFNYKNVAEKFNNKEWMEKFKYKIKFVEENQIQELEI